MKRIKFNIEKFILKEPHWFLLVRRLPNTRCSCYDRYDRTSSYWCPLCFGTGSSVQLEKVPVRRSAGYREEVDLVQIGYVSQTHPVIYTPYWLHPNDLDLFAEVKQWYGLKPVGVFRIYRIMIALPVRQSEVSYYACGCDPADFDKSRFEEAMLDKTILLHDKDGAVKIYR
ncbi:MAG: hypothetical protein KatS3mg023_3698 [Armatimonadota bacterium]|nr:MAG: hypothetical protein KatS3mg023_3698 [Armatimonadota bacterium]